MAGADGSGGRGKGFEQQFHHGLAGDEAVDQPAAHRAFLGAQTGGGMATPTTVFSAGWSSGTLSTQSLVRPSFRMPCASKAAPSCAGENHAPRLRQMA
jgi:hypothetical protein